MITASTTPPWERPSKWLSSTVIKNQSVMTADELASYLQVPRSELFELIRHEGLPVIYLSGETYMRFLRNSIDQWLKDQEVKCCSGMDALRLSDEKEPMDCDAVVEDSTEVALAQPATAAEDSFIPTLKIFRGDED